MKHQITCRDSNVSVYCRYSKSESETSKRLYSVYCAKGERCGNEGERVFCLHQGRRVCVGGGGISTVIAYTAPFPIPHRILLLHIFARTQCTQFAINPCSPARQQPLSRQLDTLSLCKTLTSTTTSIVPSVKLLMEF